jgi:hypothetical protein
MKERREHWWWLILFYPFKAGVREGIKLAKRGADHSAKWCECEEKGYWRLIQGLWEGKAKGQSKSWIRISESCRIQWIAVSPKAIVPPECPPHRVILQILLTFKLRSRPQRFAVAPRFPPWKCHFLLDMVFLVKEIANLTSNFTWREQCFLSNEWC